MTRYMQREVLKGKIHSNRNKIRLFNGVNLLLGMLFITISFLAFYIKSVLQVYNSYFMVFSLVLVLTIMVMVAFEELVKEREKENKKMQHKIYRLSRTVK